jgi:hypothetical protein
MTDYKTVSLEMHAAVDSMSAAARRLNTVFAASYVTDASLLMVKNLSDELEQANRQIRRLARAA